MSQTSECRLTPDLDDEDDDDAARGFEYASCGLDSPAMVGYDIVGRDMAARACGRRSEYPTGQPGDFDLACRFYCISP